MGFLDDLKNKSAQQQAQEAAEQARQDQLERIYRQTILPKLEYVYTYLNQMCEHLNYLNSDQTVSYQLPGLGAWQGLRQHSYSLKADSRNNMKEVLLSFFCEGGEEELTIHAKSKPDFDKYNEYYANAKLSFHVKIIKDEGQEQIGGRFFIKQRIPVAIGFFADIPNSQIVLRIRNFPEFGMRQYPIKAEMVTESFMDELARHLMHQNHDFMRLDVPTGVRESLQLKIREEQQERQRELEEADRRAAAEAELERQRNSNLVEKLKTSLKNIQKKP